MTDREALDLECELASTTDVQKALKVAQRCLRQCPPHDKALWREAVKQLESKIKEKEE